MQRLVGILIILLVCLQAPAEERTCTRRFIVGVNNYAPHFYLDSLNRPKGLSHDLIEILQERTGCVFIEKDLARPVAIEQMKAARLDLVFLILKNSEFDRTADFVPLYRTKRELMVQKSVYTTGKSVHDFFADKKVIFGNFLGSRTALTMLEKEDLLKHHRLTESVDLLTLYDSFKRKKVQAVMMAPMTNAYYVKKLEIEDQVVRIVDEKSTIEIGIYYSKRRISKAEKAQVEQALETMRNDGTLLKLLSGYMPKESDLVVTYYRP
jgi:ABC-type amino acid transport substrate-binding protein